MYPRPFSKPSFFGQNAHLYADNSVPSWLRQCPELRRPYPPFASATKKLHRSCFHLKRCCTGCRHPRQYPGLMPGRHSPSKAEGLPRCFDRCLLPKTPKPPECFADFGGCPDRQGELLNPKRLGPLDNNHRLPPRNCGHCWLVPRAGRFGRNLDLWQSPIEGLYNSDLISCTPLRDVLQDRWRRWAFGPCGCQ